MEDTKAICREGFKIAWAAGLFDGEGTIGIYKYPRKDRKSYPSIVKSLTIENTESVLIDCFAAMLKENKIKYYRLCLPSRKNKKSNPIHSVRVSSYRGIEKLLNMLIPFLVGKKEQAKAMLQFIEHRKKLGWQEGIPEKEVDVYIQKLKDLKNPQRLYAGQPLCG